MVHLRDQRMSVDLVRKPYADRSVDYLAGDVHGGENSFQMNCSISSL